MDNHDRISHATDPGVLAKRIDATIRIGRTSGYYSGPYPYGYCGPPGQEEDCESQGYPWQWDPNTCSCVCNGSPSLCA